MSSPDARLRSIMQLIRTVFSPRIIFEHPEIQDDRLKEPCVIICNHTKRTLQNCLISMDGAVIRYAFNNRNVCSLMAKDLLEKPLYRRLMSGLDCIPISRDAASTEWIRASVEKLRSGSSVIIFPEGTTIKENNFEEFKPGFALLARTAGVKVLPVAVNGIYRPFSKGQLKITIGTPQSLNAERLSPDALKAESRRFRAIVEGMYYSMAESEDCCDADENFVNIKST